MQSIKGKVAENINLDIANDIITLAIVSCELLL